MSYRATTVRNVSFPSASTVQFDQAVGDAVLAVGRATLYPQAALYSAVSKSKTGVDVLITSVVGSTVTATITSNPSGRTIAATDICEMFSLSAVTVIGDSQPYVQSVDYDWDAQAPGGSLTAGVAPTITLAPVPLGVNGTNTNYYVYVSGGAGTAEALLVTGGTAISGAAIGTLILAAPANNHSGAWTVKSASGGISEAMWAAPGKLVWLPDGYSQLYQSVYVIGACPGIIGNGYLRSLIGVNFSAASIFILPTNGTIAIFDGFSIIPLAGSMTTGAAIDITNSAQITVSNIFFGAAGGGLECYIGVRCVGPSASRVYVNDCWILANYRGLHIEVAYLSIVNVQVLSGKVFANYIADSCALYLRFIAGANIVSFIHDAGVYAYGMIADTTTAYVNELHMSNFYLDNWVLGGISVRGAGAAAAWVVSNFRIVDNNGTYLSAIGGIGIAINGAVSGWSFSNGSVLYAYGYGINVNGSAINMSFTNVQLQPIFVDAGQAAIVVNGGTPKNLSFVGCGIGIDAGAGIVSAVGFASSVAIAGLIIEACKVVGSTQALKISLAGTETGVRIVGNDGIGNVRKTVAAAATLTFPLMEDTDVIEITGSTALSTAVAGLREGQHGVMKWTDAAPGAVSQVATIQSPGFTPTRYVPYPFMFSNGVLNVG